MSSKQKMPPQIFDIWCKNIGFSPDSKFRLVSGAGREVSYSPYLPHSLLNSDMKTQASSKFSSLGSQHYSGSQWNTHQEKFLLCIPSEKQNTLSRGPIQAYPASKTRNDSQSFSFGHSSKLDVSKCSPGYVALIFRQI